ncbi:MAG: penicillin-binding transpeptidase domain-containing protein [Oscillospiraceae bacterium]|nr:penicillin-binding transpeptidase domain-containing protein [Oscillospiraceae bacterium]
MLGQNQQTFNRRRGIGTLVFISGFFLAFTIALIKIQVVDYEVYAKDGAQVSSKTTDVKASRGDLLDTNGNPLVTNRQGNSIIFESAYFPPATEQEVRNSIIHNLIRLFESNGEKWIDSLPLLLDENGRAVFPSDREADVLAMKSKDYLNLNAYATAENCMDELIAMFKLQRYPLAEARKIASVCYGLKRAQFSIQNPYTFAEDVSTDMVAKIKENNGFYKGVTFEVISYREYADGTLAPHILGTVGAINSDEYARLKNEGYGINDIVGKNGLEGAMEKYLRGKDGTKRVTKTADGAVEETVIDPTVQGNTVISTIDINLQRVVQDALREGLHNIDTPIAPAGALVVIKVDTGEVLACTSYPTYDVSTFTEDFAELSKDTENAPLNNRALNGTYEPGSTVKMSVAMAALENNLITPETTIRCTGTYEYLDQKFKCDQYHNSSYLNVNTAISQSCNCFFYECGKNLGYAKMNETRLLLGLGQETGIELSEAVGRMDSPEYRASIGGDWYLGYNVQSAIGQNNLFTPIQLANYCAVIANGGTRYRLHFVKAVKSFDYKETILENTPYVLGETGFKQENFDVVRRGMLTFCRVGNGREYFRSLPFDVAAKTGTSQVIRKVNGYNQKINNSFVVSFAPYENPEIALCVVAEGCSSSLKILPIVRAIYDYYFSDTGTAAETQFENVLIG